LYNKFEKPPVPKYGNEGTACYEGKDTRKQLTVTMGAPQRQLQHGDYRKSPFGNQIQKQSL